MKKRMFALLLAAAMFFAVLPGSSAMTLEEAKAKKAELVAAITKKNEELAAIKDQVEKAAAIRNEYASQLTDIQALIETVEVEIQALDQQISEKGKELADKQAELDEQYTLLGQRLRYMHMNNNSSTLSVILGADNFSEAMILGEYMAKISAHDTELIDIVTGLRNQIQGLKEELERDRVEQEMLLEEQQGYAIEMAKLLYEADENLTYAEAMEQVAQQEKDALLRDMEAAQADINAKMSSGWSDEPYVGGVFRWPVPGFDHISSGYGWRTLYGQPNFHAGIDIAGGGIHGAGVVTSNAGTVHTTVYGYTGYGHYIIVDHGGGWMTLYGHLSEIYVVEEEKVGPGTVIGAVGSTGNSTGPHLHFEMRMQGEKLPPLDHVLRY